MREVIRIDLLPRKAGVDLVLRASPRAYALPFSLLRAELAEAIDRLVPVKPE
jgi:hypothetical protein